MKRVLIWDISFRLANIGGPSGYLYNIHEYLRVHPCGQIVFLSDLLTDDSSKKLLEGQASFLQRMIERIKSSKLLFRLNDVLYTIWKEYHVCNVSLPSSVHLDEYDYVHFHQANDVRRYAPLFRDTHCKTILTTHCPCPRTDEILANKPWYYRLFAHWIRRQERACYAKADYLMFPCQEAREPYEKDAKIRALFHSIEHKFFYCPTAILDTQIDKSSMQKLSSLGIPEDAFVITYFGRHNRIKGYDILKYIGQELLPKYTNLYFVCAGKGEISPIKHPRWIELGFINNTNELLSQSDLYVLPNRETYFDLIVLEILRAGVPVIMAENGGNLYFRTFSEKESEGIMLMPIDDVDNLCERIVNAIRLKFTARQTYQKMRIANRKLWEKRFTMNSFIDTYLNRINELSK